MENKQTYYYLIKSVFLKENEVQDIMTRQRNGLWKKFNEEKLQKANPDFIYLDEKYQYDKNLWKYSALIKNNVDDGKYQISRKNLLHQNLTILAKKNPQIKNFLLEQVDFDWMNISRIPKKFESEIRKIKKLFENKVWIYKKVASLGGGDGVTIYDNFDKFYTDLKDYLRKYHKIWKNPTKNHPLYLNNQWILQEYLTIPNLLLFDGYKFHLRPVFLYFPDIKDPTKKHFYLYKKMFMARASKKYQEGNYYDKDIHDTHFLKTKNILQFPEDLVENKLLNKKQANDIFKQMLTLSKSLAEIINAKCYPDSKYCFELFFGDIMITTDYKIKLIEINNNAGIGSTSKFIKPIFENVVHIFVDKIVKPQARNLYENNFVKIL